MRAATRRLDSPGQEAGRARLRSTGTAGGPLSQALLPVLAVIGLLLGGACESSPITAPTTPVSVAPSHSAAHGPLAVDAGFDSAAAVVPVDSTAPGGPGPVDAEFDAVRSAPDQLLALTFQDLSTGPVTGWLWQFGDGATSSEQSPRHDYQAPGRFDVKLLVNGPAGSDERSMTVELPAQQPGYLLGLYWPPLTWVIGALIALLSGLILLYLAWLSWGAGTHRRENRVIACLLVTEAVGCMTLLLPFGHGVRPPPEQNQ